MHTARKNATNAEQKHPEKVEVFVNDKKVLVDPGTTVLQVFYLIFAWSGIYRKHIPHAKILMMFLP